MEPWLDNLSEDWKSEHSDLQSYTLNDTPNRSREGSVSSAKSQSRIPHLAQDRTKGSTNAKYLKPRSSRGIARANSSPVLAERTPSKLNVVAQHALNTSTSSQKLFGASTLPRRPSTALSASAQSVQHHTVNYKSGGGAGKDETPEWKRRLVRGEDVVGPGRDLFGPSQLEGVFKQPPGPREGIENQPSSEEKQWKPWSMPQTSGTALPTLDQYQSMKASRLPDLDVLQEESEGEDTGKDFSAMERELLQNRSLRGVVRDRVTSLELAHILSLDESPRLSRGSGSPRSTQKKGFRNDPRLRTLSGQEEVRNENISPITVSKQNTIRDRALQTSLDKSVNLLQNRLEEVALDDRQQPSSRSSDDGIQYGTNADESKRRPSEESAADLTSHSLPDDLSMGTQDFASRGGFINKRRGGNSADSTFYKRNLSSPAIPVPSHQQQNMGSTNPYFPSSPPPYISTTLASQDGTDVPGLTTTPSRPGPKEQEISLVKLRPPGSPLKLFGKHDTMTKNVLERRMSKFEEIDAEMLEAERADQQKEARGNDFELRMSQFGGGELDQFDFNQQVEPQAPNSPLLISSEKRIFPRAIAGEEAQRRAPSRNVSFDHSKTERKPDAQPQSDMNALDRKLSLDQEPKRTPKSPLKDRTPKRRRTFLRDEIEAQFEQHHKGASGELIVDTMHVVKSNRTEVHLDMDGPAGAAKITSSHEISQTERVFECVTGRLDDSIGEFDSSNILITLSPKKAVEDLTEAIADELATFGAGITQLTNDTRKPSVTTQDFLNEATKIMQLIRQKGKPKSVLSSVEEPEEESELNPDAILDLDVEGEYTNTTEDEFSRPPSRTGGGDLRLDRKPTQQDPRILSHLRKYQDVDDAELLVSTSVPGSLHLPNHTRADELALVPDLSIEQQSSPGHIRISKGIDQGRKRKYSASTTEGVQFSHRETRAQTQFSSGASTERSLPTNSSGGSGRKGVIMSGKVEIPNQVGPMTFDHSTKTWIKEDKAGGRKGRLTKSEEDPFDNIPDLSIDESREVRRNLLSQSRQSSQTSMKILEGVVQGAAEEPQVQNERGESQQEPGSNLCQTHPAKPETYLLVANLRATSWATGDALPAPRAGGAEVKSQHQIETHAEEVEHEIRIHEGRASKAPTLTEIANKQARVVTIAFSSPLVSAIAYHDDESVSEIDLQNVDVLSKKDMDLVQIEVPPNQRRQNASNQRSKRKQAEKLNPRRKSWDTRQAKSQSISRIEEQDENIPNEEMSVIHVSNSGAMTPAPRSDKSALAGARTTGRASSIICLTPLSDFSLHQADEPFHLEVSYIAQRAHPTSLRQAHGSLALAVDDLVKAITDVEPDEPYWDQIKQLNLSCKHLTTLHRLSEYCSGVQELIVSDNQIGQLSGIPSSVRMMSVQNNLLSNLTSWSHLHNLQYIDISGNGLESLDGFSSLIHLRELVANDNKIRSIEGIFDLDGLLSLRLRGNEIATVDFEDAELTRLTHLDLSDNELSSVCNIQSLPSLVDLNLEQNNLQTLPVPLTLKNLRRLKVSRNQLTTIDLLALPNIELLYLDQNQIRDVRCLQAAHCLDTLSLRDQSDSPDIVNQVLQTPNECRKIYLSSNTVPSGYLKVPVQPLLNLQYLELAACGISSVETDFGVKIPNCRVLNLNFNAIKDVGSLQGILRLNKLLLGGNRITRLRRSCLTFSKFTALTKLELRDNPLTVGFYCPPQREERLVVQESHKFNDRVRNEPYMLSSGSTVADLKWLRLLDEGTRMRRRTIELVLAEGCEMLQDLDGLPFERKSVLTTDDTWARLVQMGILKRPELVLKEKAEERKSVLPVYIREMDP